MCASLCLTFIAGDECSAVALQGGGDDGAVSVGQDVLRVVEHVLPAVGAGLHTVGGGRVLRATLGTPHTPPHTPCSQRIESSQDEASRSGTPHTLGSGGAGDRTSNLPITR